MGDGDEQLGTPPQSKQPYGLGRAYAPDPRDRAYALTPKRLDAIAPVQPTKLAHPWRLGPILDQGATSECTVYALAAFLQAAPRQHTLGWPASAMTALYRDAQRIDEWPGENYDGTSERAVLKIAQDNGYVAEYLWISDEDVAKEYVRTRGPLLFGTDWFASMFTPGTKAYLEPQGAWVGGHEVMLRWYYPPGHQRYPDSYEFVNSWSDRWGDAGKFRLKADVFRYLFLQLNGDLASAVESPVVRKKAKTAQGATIKAQSERARATKAAA